MTNIGRPFSAAAVVIDHINRLAQLSHIGANAGFLKKKARRLNYAKGVRLSAGTVFEDLKCLPGHDVVLASGDSSRAAAN